MSERKYSVSEIDQMREAIERICYPPGIYNGSIDDRRRQVEDRLRTYMLNGTEPEELLEACPKGRWED